MYCTKCGNELREGVKFCTKCGAPVTNNDAGTISVNKNDAGNISVNNNDASNIEKEDSVKQKNGKLIFIPIIVVVCVVLALGAAAYIFREDIGQFMHDKWNIDILYSGEEDDTDSEIVDVDESTQETESDVTETEETTTSADDNEVTVADWCEAYKDYLTKGDYTIYTSALIYVNDDEIPELVLVGDCEATGNLILTYDGTDIDELQTSRLYFEYIEKGNLLCNSDGVTGCYHDYIFSIENGKWKNLANGDYDLINYDTEEMEYFWDSKEVTEEEYYASLDQIFNRSAAKRVADSMPYDETIKMLEDNKPVYDMVCEVFYKDNTDIHRYEIVAGDVNWYTAMGDAESKGGYLVHINSKEEYDYITDMLENEGYHDYIIWLGAVRSGFQKKFRWGYVDESYRTSDEVLEENPVYDEFWLEGEPSYYSEGENGEKWSEDYLDMFYSKKQGKFVWNDVPDDLIMVVPSYKGKIAYVIEYED